MVATILNTTTAAPTALPVRQAAAVDRSSRDFQRQQDYRDHFDEVLSSKLFRATCKTFSEARAGKLSTPEADSAAGRWIVTMAKTSRSGRADLWHVRAG